MIHGYWNRRHRLVGRERAGLDEFGSPFLARAITAAPRIVTTWLWYSRGEDGNCGGGIAEHRNPLADQALGSDQLAARARRWSVVGLEWQIAELADDQKLGLGVGGEALSMRPSAWASAKLDAEAVAGRRCHAIGRWEAMPARCAASTRRRHTPKLEAPVPDKGPAGAR